MFVDGFQGLPAPQNFIDPRWVLYSQNKVPLQWNRGPGWFVKTSLQILVWNLFVPSEEGQSMKDSCSVSGRCEPQGTRTVSAGSGVSHMQHHEGPDILVFYQRPWFLTEQEIRSQRALKCRCGSVPAGPSLSGPMRRFWTLAGRERWLKSPTEQLCSVWSCMFQTFSAHYCGFWQKASFPVVMVTDVGESRSSRWSQIPFRFDSLSHQFDSRNLCGRILVWTRLQVQVKLRSATGPENQTEIS